MCGKIFLNHNGHQVISSGDESAVNNQRLKTVWFVTMQHVIVCFIVLLQSHMCCVVFLAGPRVSVLHHTVCHTGFTAEAEIEQGKKNQKKTSNFPVSVLFILKILKMEKKKKIIF